MEPKDLAKLAEKQRRQEDAYHASKRALWCPPEVRDEAADRYEEVLRSKIMEDNRRLRAELEFVVATVHGAYADGREPEWLGMMVRRVRRVLK